MQAARAAAEASYSPYSRFRVGAAVLAGGTVFSGCNVENASYGLTVCAERIAIFTAVAAGHRRIACIAVACVDAEASATQASLMPCGACLQVIAEFGTADTQLHVHGSRSYTLRELLPYAFRLGQPASSRSGC
ncbi:cytidine deaminase [Limobrevibacterium gyesilva]|uniref:Cytidine deaminase n=1 Tax=Limobrevibacterium gyesilva TaxID=2991712 RepID=A0AA41YI14_9PROT|nr:cytidine deaminase [Limobrevibacterium gyesilva]MCW3473856.1 cytidine deaminase [Limobrevibacterium gyesilva]